jgi:hypothetical protein
VIVSTDDRPHRRKLTQHTAAVKDREFIARLREVDLHELLRIARNHIDANEWKKVAIQRELTRRGEVWP